MHSIIEWPHPRPLIGSSGMCKSLQVMVYTVKHFKYKDFIVNLALILNLQTVESPINYIQY